MASTTTTTRKARTARNSKATPAAAQVLGSLPTAQVRQPGTTTPRNSAAWQGKGAVPAAVQVARASMATATPLRAPQVRALVAMAAAQAQGLPWQHHNPRVAMRLAAKGLCTAQGVPTPAGMALVATATAGLGS